ncbi:MAG: hypothetical protein H7334_02335 [Ferruginibacter sp.]|nr:hypothetical protein [Ferruginibacter sp.]
MHQQKYYRCINKSYLNNYGQLIDGGLYTQLTKNKWLVRHTEVSDAGIQFTDKLIILPQQIPVIVYPYEWSFAMWQDAALLTLNIAKEAIEKGMSLKDATPFNI